MFPGNSVLSSDFTSDHIHSAYTIPTFDTLHPTDCTTIARITWTARSTGPKAHSRRTRRAGRFRYFGANVAQRGALSQVSVQYLRYLERAEYHHIKKNWNSKSIHQQLHNRSWRPVFGIEQSLLPGFEARALSKPFLLGYCESRYPKGKLFLYVNFH